MSNNESNARQTAAAATQDDDEPDEWEVRINKTGCADENMRLLDCHYEKKDWRQCIKEMEQFRKCWKEHGNDKRTSTTDTDKDERC